MYMKERGSASTFCRYGVTSMCVVHGVQEVGEVYVAS